MASPANAPNQRGQAVMRAERDKRIWEMSLGGWTERQIAAEVGLSQTRVNAIISRAIKAYTERPAAEIVQREFAKLDDLERKVRAVLEAEHVLIRGDGVVMRQVMDPDTGLPKVHPVSGEYAMVEVLDDAPVLAAVDRLLKIAERRAKLGGYDAPAKVEQTTYAYQVNGIDADQLK